jgi:phosphoribosylglycinamide formyltransferase-1
LVAGAFGTVTDGFPGAAGALQGRPAPDAFVVALLELELDPHAARASAAEASETVRDRVRRMGRRLTPATMVAEVRIGVLASGSGTILQAMLERGDLPISLVLVDRACGAVDIAQSHDVAVAIVERHDYSATFDRVAYTRDVVAALDEHEIDLVAMAGFGTILEQPIHDAYAGRLVNTHPALLPAFKGWHAVRDALAFGVKVTGCTVHVATLEVDDGPILAQEAVPVLDDDTEASLHERIKAVERRLYPEVIARIARGELLEVRR